MFEEISVILRQLGICSLERLADHRAASFPVVCAAGFNRQRCFALKPVDAVATHELSFGAEYVAWLTRFRLGEMEEAEFLAELVTQNDKYLAQLDGTVTLESAGNTKAEHYDMVYSGGFIAAMSLDFLIRSQSKGKKTLDDFWTYLLNHYPRGGEVLDIPGILDAATTLYGSGVGDALEAYITSSDPIPFMENAALMGLGYEDGILSVSDNASESQKALWDGFVTP